MQGRFLQFAGRQDFLPVPVFRIFLFPRQDAAKDIVFCCKKDAVGIEKVVKFHGAPLFFFRRW